MLLRDSALKKLKVLSKDGRELGEISGFELDASSMILAAIFLRLDPDVGKDAGVKKPLLGKAELRIDTAKISGIADAVVLKVSASDLVEKENAG
jgi:sporulation protein YlmC with PRC-barrel domain